jgi:rRNA maturation protein Rpf1
LGVKAAGGDGGAAGSSDGSPGLMGLTAFFKVSNVVTSQNIPNRGAATNHIPKLNFHEHDWDIVWDDYWQVYSPMMQHNFKDNRS